MSGQGAGRGKGGKGLGKGGVKNHRKVLKESITGIVPPGIKRSFYLESLSRIASKGYNLLGICGCFSTITCAKCTEERLERERLERERLERERLERERLEFLESKRLNDQKLAAEAETKRVEAHRKLEEEFKLRMSATPFIKFVSMTKDALTTFQPDDKIECYGMYLPCPSGTNDNKFIFFVFDEEKSKIKEIDFGVSGFEKYNLYPLEIAGAMLFNDDGTHNIIEKNNTFFDIDCGKNNTYGDKSD